MDRAVVKALFDRGLDQAVLVDPRETIELGSADRCPQVVAGASFVDHLDLGARLAPLREQGVLIIGSGNVVHNLGGMTSTMPDGGFDWAERFDEQVKASMAEEPTETAALDGHRDFRTAVPTPDHYIPLLYLAGLAGAADRGADVLVDGYAYGSLSMTAYTLDLACPGAGNGTEPAAALPEGVPPDGSNI